MKLNKSAVASIYEITEATVNQMLEDGELSEDWAGVILNTFKEVLARKDTQLLALLAISCVMSLDWEQFEMFTGGFNGINLDVPKLNSLNYDVLNRVDEGLDS
jgi:hypothetical protein